VLLTRSSAIADKPCDTVL